MSLQPRKTYAHLRNTKIFLMESVTTLFKAQKGSKNIVKI